MSNQIIKIENLSKSYNIFTDRQGGYTALRDVIADKAKQAFRPRSKKQDMEEFWALKDVSFEVERGDRIGIIGRNGAGKSTLLKLLSRITEPTNGRIHIKGRVASLLEVGTGFHPELSGRENIFLNGAILGMTRAEIRKKFDEIVAFSEVEKFLDTPVKRYSSGMYVRLAFSVAAHLEPEILIVDEVLAVGDSQFQKKCLGKMEEVSKGAGRTVLFVSHNISAVKSVCNKGLLLSHGVLKNYAGVDEVANEYIKSGSESYNLSEQDKRDWHNESISLLKFDLRPLKGNMLDVESGVHIRLEFINNKPDINLDATMFFYSIDDTCLFESGCLVSVNNDAKRGKYIVEAVIDPYVLNAGSYRINLIFGENQAYVLFRLNNIAFFDIENTYADRGNNMNVPSGYMRPDVKWSKQFNDQ